MSLISLRQLLDHAAENNYGVPAFNVNNFKIETRNLGYVLSSIVLLLAFAITHINANLIPMLYGISLAIIIYMTGRCLAGIPRPRNRMIARTFACVVVAICVVLPCLSLMPLYMPANAVLPSTFLDAKVSVFKNVS